MLADVEVSEDLTEASVKLPGFTLKDLNRKRMCFQSYLFFHQQIVCQTFKISGEAFWKSRSCYSNSLRSSFTFYLLTKCIHLVTLVLHTTPSTH